MKKTKLSVFLLFLALPACEKKGKPPSKDMLSKDEPEEVAKEREPPTNKSDEDSESQDSPDFFSVEWATKTRKASAEKAATAEALQTRGYEHYKKKDDVATVAAYEKSLRAHPTARTYYRYGNSLSNIDRLPDSVKAYAMAIELGYERPEVALYNTACAYSRMEKAEKAYELLGKAVDKGYSAWRKIQRDSDLAFLRARSDWNARFSEIRNAGMGFEPEELRGKLHISGERDGMDYTLCPSGVVLNSWPTGLDKDSCCGRTLKGRWSRRGDDIVLTWTEVCGRKGTGKRFPETQNPFCVDYEGCGKRTCQPPDDRDARPSKLLRVKDVPALLRGKEIEAGYEYATLKPFEGDVPDACK